jgi:S-adenosylmethionine:tRNA ribosyltransferase-isomerase
MTNDASGNNSLVHQLDAYDYTLDERLIAQKPVEPRDSSRLLVVDRARGTLEHRHFYDLPEYLGANDLVVVNNSRVLKARLLGHRLIEKEGAWVPGGKVEFVLLEKHATNTWEGLFHASARYVRGLRFEIPTPDGQGLRGVLVRGVAESPHGTVVAEFDRDPVECDAGELPLPHYIKRSGASAELASGDTQSYQTLYAKDLGSAAAPTAGLHFTPNVIEKLRARAVAWDEVTLHVGLGTFRPVKEADIRKHQMHEERYDISAETAERINVAKKSGKKILAVGTTCVRTLESAWGPEGLRAGPGRTSLFIRPGAYEFKAVDRILTNFHLPKSTLLMLICAFGGRELILKAYEEAVKKEYRFFSYGDSMLIL